MVRDLLNMTFILVLLFAAFCTIFQIDKWNLKKVWLNVLINALLVNFSYPIARFFIDVSNVAFYYFVNNLFYSTGPVTGSGIFAMFGASSNISNILKPDDYANFSIAYLITMIIVLFIMGMTLLIIAALFIVRLIVLIMIVMFSPIGFVGYIFPATASYADKWWKNLFSYSFFAPIMIFGMAIALRVTEAIGKDNMQAFRAAASQNTPASESSFIASAAFMVIPITILWATIGVAKSAGIEGADKVVSSVKKGGKWVANRPGAVGGYAWKQSGIPGGVKKGIADARKSGKLFGYDNKFTQFALKDGREGREGGIAGVMGKGKKGWADAHNKAHNASLDEDIKKGIDDHDTMTTTNLKAHLASGSVEHRAAMNIDNRKAGVEYMAKYKQLMADPIRKQEHEADVRVAALAAIPATISGMTDGSEKTAKMEAHIQQQIAASYSDLKTNFQAVKNVHKK
jgi:hypothetical protein